MHSSGSISSRNRKRKIHPRVVSFGLILLCMTYAPGATMDAKIECELYKEGIRGLDIALRGYMINKGPKDVLTQWTDDQEPVRIVRNEKGERVNIPSAELKTDRPERREWRAPFEVNSRSMIGFWQLQKQEKGYSIVSQRRRFYPLTPGRYSVQF